MSEEKLSLSLYKSGYISYEYFAKQRKYKEQELAIKLFSRFIENEYYTIKIKRIVEPDYALRYIEGHDNSEKYTTEVWIGKVKPLEMKYKPQPYLNLKDRLKVLFTGHFPVGIGWE
jgi:hypothetical protein